jgi:regulator of protease activity HflC (stomatin/prohibitin superfamily)
MNEYREPNYAMLVPFFIMIGLLFLAGLITLGMYGCPLYNVYEQRKEGEASLAHAQSSKEVAVAEAKAKMESASLLAQAEVRRAEGVAQANKIIGESLKGNEAYLRYLWINQLESNHPTIIYVPTETNLPILEATRKP